MIRTLCLFSTVILLVGMNIAAASAQPSGLAVSVDPDGKGGMVSADVFQLANSVKSRGFLGTLKAAASSTVDAVSNNAGKSTAGLATVLALVLKNNPRFIGLEKKSRDPAAVAPGQANNNTASTRDSSVNTTIVGDGNVVQVNYQSENGKSE